MPLMKIVAFIKRYFSLRRKQSYLLKILSIKDRKRDTPELAELRALESVLQPVQAKLFTYVFITLLSALIIAGFILNFIHASKSPVFLDVHCESIEFDTPLVIELSNKLNASMYAKGSINLSDDWQVDFGLSSLYQSPLSIDCKDVEDQIEIEHIHIPANSHITVRRQNNNHLLIIEPRDTIDPIEISFYTDSAFSSFDNSDQIFQERLIHAKSLGSNEEYTLEFSEPTLRWFNFQANHFSYLQQRQSVIKGGEERTTTSITKAGIYFEEIHQDTIKINYHDTLDVQFVHPTINQMEISSNMIHIQSRGITNHILGGSMHEQNRSELDLRPSIWVQVIETTAPEIKNFILAILLSVFGFVFIRQRKNI